MLDNIGERIAKYMICDDQRCCSKSTKHPVRIFEISRNFGRFSKNVYDFVVESESNVK